MLIVHNHHVIVPQFEDLGFVANAITPNNSDTISIELFGDSIMCGRDPDRTPPAGGVCSGDYITARVPDPPDQLLAKFLPQYKLEVTTRSVGGSTSGNLLQGTDGVNAAWPDDIQANIVVINHGLNDARYGISINNYRNNLLALRQGLPADKIIVWQTPTQSLLVNTAPYAATMINVASQFGDIVADAHSIDNWTSRLPDGVHPRQLGYAELVDLCLSNAVNQAVVRCLGTDQHNYLRKNYQEKFKVSNASELQLTATPKSSSWIEIYVNDNPLYQVVSRGELDLYGILPAGFNDYQTQVSVFQSSPGYNLTKIRRATGKPVYSRNYSLATVESAQALADDLNQTSSDYIVVISTKGDAVQNRTVPELVEAMRRCGASTAIYENSLLKSKSAYALVGIPGAGPNGGYEAYSGEVNDDVVSYAEILFEVSAAGTIVVKDIYPPVPRTTDNSGSTVPLLDPMYSLISNVPASVGSRIINARYPTYKTNGIPYEQYNISGNTIFFTKPINGTITVISDAVSEPPRSALRIPVQNIHSLNYYVQRFNPARWAPGNLITNSTTTTSQDPLAPPVVVGASGVNNLGLYNTMLKQRIGDAHYAEPVLVTPPEHGAVRLSSDRKSFTYTPHAGFVGLDSFVYTLLTQHGQTGQPKAVYIQVVDAD
jgi:lysophospholipase L1-like esterase